MTKRVTNRIANKIPNDNKNYLKNKDNSIIENRVIIVESLIKSKKFFDYLKLSINKELKKNKISIDELKSQGYFYIVKLKDHNNNLLDALELLSKISGYSYIMISQEVKIDYDLLSNATIEIGKKTFYEDDKFSIIIKSYKEDGIIQKNVNKIPFDIRDFKFFVQSELSSMSTKVKYVDDHLKADKLLYVFFGDSFAYVSIYIIKGKNNIPFNFFNTCVFCPVYDEVSSLSLDSVLNAGFIPDILVFYPTRPKLIELLKNIEFILIRFSIKQVCIRLINMDKIKGILKINDIENKTNLHKPNYHHRYQHHHRKSQKENSILNLIKVQIIIESIAQINDDVSDEFVLVPFNPYIHPFWFLKKLNKMVHFYNKIPLNPFIFSNPQYLFNSDLKSYTRIPSTPKLFHDPFERNNMINIEEQDFENFLKLYFPNGLVRLLLFSVDKRLNKDDDGFNNDNNPNYYYYYYRKFLLNVGKDDILDVLDSI